MQTFFILVALSVFYGSDICTVSLENIMGHQFCQVSYWIGLYGLVYLNVGSLGIAVYRFLCIKTEHLVKKREKRLLAIILMFSLTGSAAMVFMFCYESTNQRTVLNTCRGISSFHAQVLIDYSLSLGNAHHTTNTLQKMSIFTLIWIQTAEFSICIWFFYFQYKHNNGNIKMLLDQEVIRERNLKNITTFVGHVYGFLTEYIYLLLSLACILIAGEDTIHYQAIANIAKCMDFGLLSTVEVFTSPSLRRFMKK